MPEIKDYQVVSCVLRTGQEIFAFLTSESLWVDLDNLSLLTRLPENDLKIILERDCSDPASRIFIAGKGQLYSFQVANFLGKLYCSENCQEFYQWGRQTLEKYTANPGRNKSPKRDLYSHFDQILKKALAFNPKALL
ncbi:MAG: hypothetical protein H6581_07830 [Bacteroidia bacterium]|nr:hypothetical protein [Bacteroidia bacterium]